MACFGSITGGERSDSKESRNKAKRSKPSETKQRNTATSRRGGDIRDTLSACCWADEAADNVTLYLHPLLNHFRLIQ